MRTEDRIGQTTWYKQIVDGLPYHYQAGLVTSYIRRPVVATWSSRKHREEHASRPPRPVGPSHGGKAMNSKARVKAVQHKSFRAAVYCPTCCACLAFSSPQIFTPKMGGAGAVWNVAAVYPLWATMAVGAGKSCLFFFLISVADAEHSHLVLAPSSCGQV